MEGRYVNAEYVLIESPVVCRTLGKSFTPFGSERGEFHTFAYDGPMFDHPVPVQSGEIVERDGFVFADLLHPIFD